MKVFVYYNLHKHLWSVKALEGKNQGRIIHRGHDLEIKDCVFKVSELRRQRVIAMKRRVIHAGIVGDFNRRALKTPTSGKGVQISYNPYKGPHFYEVETGKSVFEAKKVVFEKNRKVLAFN